MALHAKLHPDAIDAFSHADLSTAGAKYNPPIAVVVRSRVASGSLTLSSFWAQASLAPKMAALVAAFVANGALSMQRA